MKQFLLILVLGTMFLGIGNKMMAQGEAAVPFLLLAPDSRAGGLGESNAGLADNGAAIFWNPAGITLYPLYSVLLCFYLVAELG